MVYKGFNNVYEIEILFILVLGVEIKKEIVEGVEVLFWCKLSVVGMIL